MRLAIFITLSLLIHSALYLFVYRAEIPHASPKQNPDPAWKEIDRQTIKIQARQSRPVKKNREEIVDFPKNNSEKNTTKKFKTKKNTAAKKVVETKRDLSVSRKQAQPKPLPSQKKIYGTSTYENSRITDALSGEAPLSDLRSSDKQSSDIRPTPTRLKRSASLERKSFTPPKYTLAALDEELSGTYQAKVLVDAKGNVTGVYLNQPVGMGMDERIIKAIEQARFSPAINTKGQAMASETTVTIHLRPF